MAEDLLAPTKDVSSSFFDKLSFTFKRRYQKFQDDVNPYFYSRWIATATLFFLYFYRVYMLSGFYIVTYALGIYLLNLLIGFLTPLVDPAQEKAIAAEEAEEEKEAADAEEGAKPETKEEEFKPFIRKIPEFKYWMLVTRAVLISFVCTLFPFLDLPVFWPILLIYFIVLFGVTMKRQIKHMIKHGYIPVVNAGKPKFQNA